MTSVGNIPEVPFPRFPRGCQAPPVNAPLIQNSEVSAFICVICGFSGTDRFQFRFPNSFMRCHHPPRDEALVHLPQAATEQPAQQVEELDCGVRIHRQNFFQQ